MMESDRARHGGYAAEREDQIPTAGWVRGRVDSIVDNTFLKVSLGIRKISALPITPWFHVTDLPNVPPGNLVQISIGGCGHLPKRRHA